MKQGDREVTEYYTEMLGLWQDLDLNCEEEWGVHRGQCALQEEDGEREGLRDPSRAEPRA